MATGTYGAFDGAGPSPWRGGYGPPHFWPVPRPFYIAGMVLAFIVWWPLGLATLAYLIGSGRMGCRSRRYRTAENPWNQGGPQGAPWSGPWSMWRNFCGGSERPAASSGNAAFDEYRTDTLRRLEEEQKEFAAFLERLRVAKDKSEFDAFMNDRRQRAQRPPEEPQTA